MQVMDSERTSLLRMKYERSKALLASRYSLKLKMRYLAIRANDLKEAVLLLPNLDTFWRGMSGDVKSRAGPRFVPGLI